MTVESLLELSPPLLLVSALNVLGFALKKSPVANWVIPWCLILAGALIYPFIAEIGKISFQVGYPVVFNIVIGLCIGGAATGVHQAMSRTKDRIEDGKEPPKT